MENTIKSLSHFVAKSTLYSISYPKFVVAIKTWILRVDKNAQKLGVKITKFKASV